MIRHRTFAALTLAFCLAAPSAFAQSADTEKRQAAIALFDDARQLMHDGNFTAACPKLAESQRLDPGIGTLYNLADCYEHEGRLASAWIHFREAAAQAAAAGQTKRQESALKREQALEPQLMRMRVVVDPNDLDQNVEILRDGVPMTRPLWGTAVPVDAGDHTIIVSAPDHETWQSTVKVTGSGKTMTITVPRLWKKVDGVSHSSGAPATTEIASTSNTSDSSSSRSWQKPLGITALAVGVVGVGLGTVFGLAAKGSFNDAKSSAGCNAQGQCDAPTRAKEQSAANEGNVGTGFFIGGAIIAVAGIILWATSPSAQKKTGFVITPSRGGLSGTW